MLPVYPYAFVNRRSRVQISKVARYLTGPRGPVVALGEGHAQVRDYRSTDRERAYGRERYHRRRAESSCTSCGAEAQAGRTRCLPCGQRNAGYARKQWPLRKVAS